MITHLKIETYKRFAGDIDDRVRAGGSTEDDFTDAEWFILDELLLRLTIRSRGLASESFKDSAFSDLNDIAPEPSVRTAILDLIPRE